MSASAVSPGVQAPPVKYVVFRLGGAVRLALPQMAVREGLDMASVVVAPMPGAAAMFQGIANVRGNFLWVLDLARLLRQLEPDLPLPVTPHREGLVVQGGQRAVVVTIQGRDGFLPLGAKDIQTPAPSAP
jgi:chemotaxis signal transduction protein